MSNDETGIGGRPISLDQLVALNEEMAALVRAGVPLEQGLGEIARDMPGRVGEIATHLSERMQAGESLSQVLATDEKTFPPVWRAVVEAGQRSGRLASALEGLTTTVRRAAELRHAVGTALVYPLAVVGLAYGLFVFAVIRLAPVTLGAYEDLTSSSDPVLASMAWLGQTAKWWVVWPPLVLSLFLVFRWYRSGRASITQGQAATGRREGLFGRCWPCMGRSIRDGRMATFAELLSLLIKQHVPLQEAIVLAADASGDRGLSRAAQEIAGRQQSGELFEGRDSIPAPFPPLLGWLVLAGADQPGIGDTLLRTADAYRERAAHAATWTSLYLPIVLTAVFGGAATVFQAVVTIGPVYRMLYELGQPF